MICYFSSSADKVRLFSDIFKGRTDVFARRYESAVSGKTGFSPVCHNRWDRLLCDAKRTHCATCPNSRFAAWSDEAATAHLLGHDCRGRPFTAAIYPMTPDERVRLCTVSLGEDHWRENTTAVQDAARSLGIPCLIERADDGVRIWFLFKTLVEARLAREVATAVLFAAFMRHPELGVGVFDSITPPLDTLPRNHIGQFIPLPLSKEWRNRGRTVFLDDGLKPSSDQWALLANAKLIGEREAAAMAKDAIMAHRTIAPTTGEIADGFNFLAHPSQPSADKHTTAQRTTIAARIDSHLRISSKGLPPEIVAELTLLASFTNPSFHDAQRMRLPTRGIPRIISRADLSQGSISLPRGCLDDTKLLLDGHGFHLDVEDDRFAGVPITASFQGELRQEQKRAASAMLRHDTGILAAGTAFGKTVLAAYIIAARKVNTLVIVNRVQLQMQWVARLATFLGVEEKTIGRIGGGAAKATGGIDIALVQSLSRNGVVRPLPTEYGQIIVDECHGLPAPTFEAVIDAMRPKYILGLSATVARRDGHHPQIALQCGPVRHRADGRRTTALEPFAHIVIVRPTEFTPSAKAIDKDGKIAAFALLDEIVANDERNRRIVADVMEAVSAGRSPVILSDRRDHLDVLETALTGKIENVVMLRGGMGKRNMKKVLERLGAIPDSAPRVLLATGQYLGEGFDDSRLDTLFLATPVSWRGRITQYVGRLHRRHAGKREVRVYDYVDVNVPVCRRMFDRRSAGYDALGYRMELPISATPGWPDGISVPLDGGWQETYGASVKRLCADGVDAALASLFVIGAKAALDNGEDGAARARSAAESFLYRRLDTLQATHGLFTLNDRLPIAFGDEEFMEPDLLCADLRIVIEIDGVQHLGSIDAYRRDRRKDMLLQERGYFVMRFLYDDVFLALDRVQGLIIRAVERRRGDFETPR